MTRKTERIKEEQDQGRNAFMAVIFAAGIFGVFAVLYELHANSYLGQIFWGF